MRIASAMPFSSMFAWNVSYIIRQFGWSTALTKLHRVGRTRQKIRLEPVEILDGQHHAGDFCMLGDDAHAVDAPLPFVFRRPFAAEQTDRGMVRTADRIYAEFDGNNRACAWWLRRRRRDIFASDEIGLSALRADGDGGSLEAQIVEPLRPGLKAGRIAAEDRHLHAVVPDFLSCSRTGIMPSFNSPVHSSKFIPNFMADHPQI